MATIDIFKNPKGAINKLRSLLGDQFEDAVRRAADIVEEEYQNFFEEAVSKGLTGVFASAHVERNEKRSGGRLTEIAVFVPKTGGGGNLVFHVLNEGTDTPLGSARAYGMKAWPMAWPRSSNHGNVPMTVGGSANLNIAYSGEPIVYRPVINNNIGPRHFVDEIQKRAEKRFKDEGLDSFISVKTSEQG